MKTTALWAALAVLITVPATAQQQKGERYPLRGQVTAKDAGKLQVAIAAKRTVAEQGGLIVRYAARDSSEFATFRVFDWVVGELVVDANGHHAENVRIVTKAEALGLRRHRDPRHKFDSFRKI